MTHWFIFGLACLALEFLIPGGIVSFIGLAAFIVGLGIYLGWIQTWMSALTALLVISVFFLLILRSLFLKLLPSKTEVGNSDDWEGAIGSEVEVLEDIPVVGEGRIKYSGTSWRAVLAVETGQIKAVLSGEKVKILERRGQVWVVNR